MGAIDIMCLPSHREPCALVYVEAALSEPIVACRARRSSGVDRRRRDRPPRPGEEQRRDRHRDQDVSTTSPTSEARCDLGEAGRTQALEIFGWDRCVQTLESIWTRVLDERPLPEKRLSGSSPICVDLCESG